MVVMFACFSLGGYFAAERLSEHAKTLEKVCAGIKKYRDLMSVSGREVASILPESFVNTGITFNGNIPRLPGNIILPMADLCALPYMVEVFVCISNGNIAKSLVMGISTGTSRLPATSGTACIAIR